MSPKVLRRCSVCGNFHASYLVPEREGGKGYYCYNCWMARFSPKPGPSPEMGTEQEERVDLKLPHSNGGKDEA